MTTIISSKLIRYGSQKDQVADLVYKRRSRSFRGTVLLLHGGFWKDEYRRDLMNALALDLAQLDLVVVNLEYRRVGGTSDGGRVEYEDRARWTARRPSTPGAAPSTLSDVARGLALLEAIPIVDPQRVFVVGHSAGGQLALWLASQSNAHRGRGIVPKAALALAPVSDMKEGLRLRLGNGAVARFLGRKPSACAEYLRRVSPLELLPLGVPQFLVHGTRDRTVPIDMSRRYVRAARKLGDQAALIEVRAGHMALIDPSTEAWSEAKRILETCVVTNQPRSS